MGLAGHSGGRQKLLEDSLPRPYWDQKSLFQRQCKNKSSFPIGERLREFANKWMGITHDSFMLGTIQGHLLQFNQKPPQVRSTNKCKVKVPKCQESMMASEVRSILSKSTLEVDPGNKGFLAYLFLTPKKNGESFFIMNLKLLNHFITCTKFKMTTQKQIREAIHPGQWAVSFQHQVSLLPHPNSKETSMFPSIQVERQSLPVQDLALLLIHCCQDLCEGHETHPTSMTEDRYNSFFIPLQCSSTSQLLHSSQRKWAESGVVVTETGLCAEPGEVPVGNHPRIYTPGPGVQHTKYDLVTSSG